MPEFKIESLETSMSAILNTFAEEKKIIDMIKPKFEELKKHFNTDKIGHCIERYINSELDFTTVGNRGIGRMTYAIPRLGGYFRSQLSKMSEATLSELYS
ncbi:hypothetical protein HQ550_04270, partial [bacterium]|nr:hypothetical protein [bacterium]